jgi:CelD/BcsL family acetyltransferase involved in cellulose biosynthesis
MSIEIDALEGGFAAAAGWWDRVLESSHRPSPFVSHAWLGRWWEVYGEGARLLLVRLRDGTREVGGGAFYIRTRRLKGLLAVRELRLVGDRLVGSEGLDLLVAERGLEGQAAGALGHFLTSIERGWDVAHLQGLRPGAVLLRPEAVGDSASVSISGVNRCPFLRLQTGRPVAPLRKHFASRVARKSRRLIDREGMRFARCTSEAECETLLDALFALHQRRWRTRGERGGFAAHAKRDFYRLVSPDLLRAGRLELFGLWDRDRPRAVLFGASAGRTLFYLQSSFDPDFAPHGPGNVLMLQILRDAQARGFERFDFMKGDDAYKFQWTAEEEPLLLRRAAGRGWRGRLAGATLALAGRLKPAVESVKVST